VHLETKGLKMFLDDFGPALRGFLCGEEESSVVDVE
jgi:hypothetical protein